MAGTLYLVSTPIGNLQDITLRALSTLKAVPRIAAEDTRRTRALLSHFGIAGKELVSCNAYASEGALRELCESLLAGQDLALVTDAGTPSVSDPGSALVRAALAAELRVIPIPGVSAVTAAVAGSGLVDGPFCFLGFPPPRSKRRAAFFARALSGAEPSVLFEAPHRIERTLRELAELDPERRAVLARELTKLHEEFRRGTLSELAASLAERPVRGEITLVLAAASAPPAIELDEEALDERILGALRAGESPRSLVDALGPEVGVPRRELYRRITELAEELRSEEPSDATEPDEEAE